MPSWATGSRQAGGWVSSTTQSASSGRVARACSAKSCGATRGGSETGWATMPDPRLHDEHAWFRALLDAYALDLLDENEQQRFLEHAKVCERCAAAMKDYSESAPVGGLDSHIPPH